MSRPTRIIANGQTGAALGALRAGLILGIPTGGTMPRGFIEYESTIQTRPGRVRNRVKLTTIRTPRQYYAKRYGIVEGAEPSLTAADIANIRAADLTILFGDTTVPRNRLLLRLCGDLHKPVATNPTPEFLQTCDLARVTIHVCGNRESSLRGIEAYVVHGLVAAWGTPERLAQHPLPKYLPRIR